MPIAALPEPTGVVIAQFLINSGPELLILIITFSESGVLKLKFTNATYTPLDDTCAFISCATPVDKAPFPPMKVGGVIYAEKSEAGKAIIEACKAMTSPDPILLGEYRGLTMILSFDSFGKEYQITVNGALSHNVKLGADIHGNITRLDNKLNGLPDSLRNCEEKLSNIQTQMEAAKSELDRPFPQEQEYADKTARLKVLNILLNMDEKGHEIFDGEPDEGDYRVHAEGSGTGSITGMGSIQGRDR